MSQYTAGKKTLDMNKKNLGYELLLNTGRTDVQGVNTSRKLWCMYSIVQGPQIFAKVH